MCGQGKFEVTEEDLGCRRKILDVGGRSWM